MAICAPRAEPVGLDGCVEISNVDVNAVAELPAHRGRTVCVRSRSIALFQVGDAVDAIDDGF
jgi:hypothetical protein